ncbi:hypothetical protein V3C99_014148 [Haemonchus contortus]
MLAVTVVASRHIFRDMSANETCGPALETASYIYPIILHLISILLTSRALQIQFRLREMFHPFFSLLLFLVLLSYNLSNVLSIIGTLLVMFGVSEEIVYIGHCLYYLCYYYINGMMFCLVVERLVATILMKTYEYNRKWWPVALSQPFAIMVAIVNFFIRNITSKVISMMALYALNIVCLIILLCVNYRITRALAGTGATLSTRYQITENIRTIRVLLPTVLCDAMVSAIDVSGALYFDLQHVFQVTRCTEEHYIAAFYGFISASAIFEFLVPLSLLLSHPAYRRHSLLLYERQPMRIQQTVIKDKTLPKVINVLGIEIANAGEQAYFENLSRVWNLRL